MMMDFIYSCISYASHILQSSSPVAHILQTTHYHSK